VAALRPEVDHVVRGFNYIQLMFGSESSVRHPADLCRRDFAFYPLPSTASTFLKFRSL
jgi:hypothetical protein